MRLDLAVVVVVVVDEWKNKHMDRLAAVQLVLDNSDLVVAASSKQTNSNYLQYHFHHLLP